MNKGQNSVPIKEVFHKKKWIPLEEYLIIIKKKQEAKKNGKRN